MTVEEARKLIDLFLDDDLPMELASEFKQAMFEDAELRNEVSSLRQVRETISAAFEGDAMRDDERARVLSRILIDSGARVSQDEFVAPPRQLPLFRQGA
jgi:hypothetical protein